MKLARALGAVSAMLSLLFAPPLISAQERVYDPEASLAELGIELPVPPTGKPAAVSFSMSGTVFSYEVHMNSALLRVVNRM